ncbi:MAG: hypothetical protein R2867_38550 [Caldilineaceae bacterium]
MRFLLHFAATAPLLVVGTVRSEEVEDTHPLTLEANCALATS